MLHLPRLLLIVSIAALNDVAAFTVPQTQIHQMTSLNAKKQTKKPTAKSSGGGFGTKPAAVASGTAPVSADKNALETQWDTFASITDLEVVPPGNPEDEDYQHFIVADVFVRVGSPSDDANDDDSNSKPITGWYRTGKVVAAGETDINASLTLQRGLIFWTAAHMWHQISSKGKDAAKYMELGFLPPSLNMADGSESALDEEEAGEVQISQRVPGAQGVSIKDVGFRPDFNPPGFSYKRRESAAMKKKKSAMEEIAEAS